MAGLLMHIHANKTQAFALSSDLLSALARLHSETELCASALTFQPDLNTYDSESAEDVAFVAYLDIHGTA